jgi:hypothetical protein
MLEDWGLGCISAHWSADELFQRADQSIAYAKEFGMTPMAIAALGPWSPRTTETVDDVKRYVEPFNAFAENAHAAGIIALLHNESFVSEHIDGKPVYDMMIADLNPATTWRSSDKPERSVQMKHEYEICKLPLLGGFKNCCRVTMVCLHGSSSGGNVSSIYFQISGGSHVHRGPERIRSSCRCQCPGECRSIGNCVQRGRFRMARAPEFFCDSGCARLRMARPD